MKLRFYLFSLLILKGFLSFSQGPCSSSSLLSCYSYENNLYDGSGNKHHASPSSNDWTYSPGFNATNNSLDFTGNNSLNITYPELATQQYTYSTWVKLDELPATGSNFTLISMGSQGGDQFLGVFNDYFGMTGFGIVSHSESTVHRISLGTLPTVDDWYHVAVTRNQDSLNLYVNNVRYKLTLNDQSVYYGPGVFNATIGTRDHAASGSNNLKGTLDESKIYNAALKYFEVKALFDGCNKCTNYSICLNSNMQENLDACYSFENNIYDGSGFGRNGTSSTSLNYSLGHNAENNSIILDGDDFIDITNDALTNDEFTYSTWVKLSALPTPGTNSMILSIGSSGGDQNLGVFNNQNGLNGFGFVSYSGSVTNHIISSGSLPTLNQWYHVVVTRNSSSMSLFINGDLSQTISLTNAPVYYGSGTFGARIGARNHDVFNWNQLVGELDETKIFEKLLSPEEIEELFWVSCLCIEYNVCSNSDVQNSLLACYSFEDNIYDGSGSGLNASSLVTPVFSADRNDENKCLALDGSNNLTMTSQEFNQQEFTYASWVRMSALPAPGTNSMILSIGSSGGDQNLGVFNNQNGINGFGFVSYSGALTNHVVTSGIMPIIDEWNHVAVTRNSSSMSIYVNGILSQTIALSNASVYYGTNTFAATIGARNHYVSTWNKLNGLLDETKIFSRVLSAEEIIEQYNVTCLCNDYLVNSILSNSTNDLTEESILFPNPTENVVNIFNKRKENIVKVTFEDLSGKIVQESSELVSPGATTSKEINLVSGFYIAVLEFETGERQAIKVYVK